MYVRLQVRENAISKDIEKRKYIHGLLKAPNNEFCIPGMESLVADKYYYWADGKFSGFGINYLNRVEETEEEKNEK